MVVEWENVFGYGLLWLKVDGVFERCLYRLFWSTPLLKGKGGGGVKGTITIFACVL